MVFLWSALWRRVLHIDESPDEIHFTQASDGWRLSATRYCARGDTVALEPVILCHGIGANRRNLDLGERRSLALYLAAQGFDTWIVELRGHGRSSAPPRPGMPANGWDFDAFVERDTPAFLDLVVERTGADRVHWVGHSMGGLVIQGYVGRTKDERIASVACIGAPADCTAMLPATQRALALGRYLPLFLGVVPLRLLGRLFAPFGGLLQYIAPVPVVNPENMDAADARRAFVHLAANINLRVLRQFSHWALDGKPGFRSADGRTDYLASLQGVSIPAWFVAGSLDKVCPPPAARAAFEAWGGDKEWREFGRGEGDAVDYGHGDLLVGVQAPDEVYPAVAEWLYRRQKAQPRLASRSAARSGANVA